MAFTDCVDRQIALIYNIDPEWRESEQHSAERESRRLGYALRRQGLSVSFVPVTDGDLTALLAGFDPEDTLVFNWCEELPGITHSEQDVAGLLEKMGFVYTGASSGAIRLCYDKPRIKALLEARGVPTPRWMVMKTGDERDWQCYPAIVKPAREHCSLGVNPDSVVTNVIELRKRVRWIAKKFNQPALVEDFIDGREFHVPLWGNKKVEMLPPVEMDFSAFLDFHKRLCSYDAKFEPGSEAYEKIISRVPARLSRAEQAELERVSIAAYKVAGCRDYGRIDARLRDGVFYILDVNPNADISADASIALSASRAGYCYGKAGARIAGMAADRFKTAHPTSNC